VARQCKARLMWRHEGKFEILEHLACRVTGSPIRPAVSGVREAGRPWHIRCVSPHPP
jgi:hypothetical protein